MRPPKSILDQSFKYTPSHKTDVSQTFERIRREMQSSTHKQVAKVAPITRRSTT